MKNVVAVADVIVFMKVTVIESDSAIVEYEGIRAGWHRVRRTIRGLIPKVGISKIEM